MGRRVLKEGMSLWSVWADPEGTDDNQPFVERSEWVVRSFKRKPIKYARFLSKEERMRRTAEQPVYVNLVRKGPCTWGKRSRKKFDYGWLKTISRYDRKSFTLQSYEEGGLPVDISFTQAGAYKIAIDYTKKHWKTMNEKYEDLRNDADLQTKYKKVLQMLNAQHTRAMNEGR